MNRSWSLFSFLQPHRCYARLDSMGRCQAFKQCKQPPVGDNWVEIEEIRLNWLHQVLPASARMPARTTRSAVLPALGL
ncbi:hypothetical protein [Pseudomonas sp. PS01297]|uniref:hypothetical protein n=1 Tax=Pseudomonas sp. PS01297 TaxID=2991433 RepID=UPI00249B3402|nr:hypothetical protein [Pseudomonas sp. PS01297]